MSSSKITKTSNIELIFKYNDHDRERVIYIDGVEKFYDKKNLRLITNESDPIRLFERFLTGEEIQSCCNRCCNTCNLFYTRRKRRINFFSELHQFIIKFFKIGS